MTTWKLSYTAAANVKGGWTTAPIPKSFASKREAWEWWLAHYRGEDRFGNEAHPEVVGQRDPSQAAVETCPSCSDDISSQGGWCATCDG